MLFIPGNALPDKVGQVKHWQKPGGSAASLAISELAASGTPILYLCANAAQLEPVAQELAFFNQRLRVSTFPDWECLPYDRVSPHPQITSTRLKTLSALATANTNLLIAPITSVMQRLCPEQFVQSRSFSLQSGDEIELDVFRQRLLQAGYYLVNQVMSPGEFAVRGGIVDVFPMGAAQPFRLDLFDNLIESIRLFNPHDQRSSDTLDTIQLLPAREIPIDEPAIRHFRQAFRAEFDGDPNVAQIYRDISKGHTPAGTEFYLPLFFEQTATLFDYLADNTVVVIEQGALENIDDLFIQAQQRFDNALLNPQWPPLAVNKLFINREQIFATLKNFKAVHLNSLNPENHKHSVTFPCSPPPAFNINPHHESPYLGFQNYLQENQKRCLVVTESPGRRENLLGVLKAAGCSINVVDGWQEFLDSAEQLAICVAGIDRGLSIDTDKLELIAESQLYGTRAQIRRRRSEKNRDPEAIIKSLAELDIGDPVVHEDHGIGRYQGLNVLTLAKEENEFVTIEYRHGDKVYIPVLALDKVSRYIGGTSDTAPLHQLGSDAWLKQTSRAREKAYDIAAELLDIQALRNARQGYAFPDIDASYDAFAAGFKFEETADQAQVIDDVINDMKSSQPMDRLVCGDVGFGKTEVALRAAYMAIAGNKQVVVLVPTTLLATQHFNHFADRFADWPVNIELFSRFRSSKEIATAIEGVKTGTVDIAIGTHKLLQKDINFADLGLMIIDEEHRFGVRQKEQLKKLRSQVDILTLTATPIPRTLNFALSGLRDISIIATPPKARLAVKTFVREWDNNLIKEAIVRELRRGGQLYFLHNEVQTIEKMRQRILNLAPEATVEIGHGQMPEHQLESVMRDFYQQRFNVLLSTTIIESGLDVPTANTIIINRADRFGLAQLHQLRGRVGRSHHQAYAYLITPSLSSMTTDAKKRLLAIESLGTLGAGFALASQDLEIRGAGELLGESQSGTIDQIGYSLYRHFLEQAIQSIQQRRANKQGEPFSSSPGAKKVDINLHIPARFPDHYIPDVSIRLTLYKRLSSAKTKEQINDLQTECIDRFGLLPDAAKNLFAIAERQLAAALLDIKEAEIGPQGGVIKFNENPAIDLQALLQLVQVESDTWSFKGAEIVQLSQDMPEARHRFNVFDEFIKTIALPVT